MDDAVLQAYARFAAHEFLLEVLYANVLAQMSEVDAEEFAAELRRRSRSGYFAPDADQAAAEAHGSDVARECVATIERFLQKAEARAAGIRSGGRG